MLPAIIVLVVILIVLIIHFIVTVHHINVGGSITVRILKIYTMNISSYQYPSISHINLEFGKYYVWQIMRSFETTLGTHYDYSPINVFEIRAPDKLQLDYSDPYLSVIESIIGEEQFFLWFSPGGELERFTTVGDVIWKNDEKIHIEELYPYYRS